MYVYHKSKEGRIVTSNLVSNIDNYSVLLRMRRSQRRQWCHFTTISIPDSKSLTDPRPCMSWSMSQRKAEDGSILFPQEAGPSSLSSSINCDGLCWAGELEMKGCHAQDRWVAWSSFPPFCSPFIICKWLLLFRVFYTSQKHVLSCLTHSRSHGTLWRGSFNNPLW